MFEIRIAGRLCAKLSRLDDAINRARHMGPRAWVFEGRQVKRELKGTEQVLVKQDKTSRGAGGNARGKHTEVLRHYVVDGVRWERVF
jgi:hypothetical protein